MLPGRIYDAERILDVLWRRKWLVVAPIVVAAAVSYFITSKLPDRYRSETSILVVPQRVPESYVRSTVTMRIEDRLRTLTQQIQSRTRLEQMINEFNLYPEERKTLPMEDVVARMREQDVETEQIRSDSFRLAFMYTDPETTMKVAARLASLYIEENVKDRETQAEGTNQFLEQQLDEARRRLLTQERKLEVYRLSHSGELPSQLASNLQVIQSAQQQVQSVLESINNDRDRRAQVDRAIANFAVDELTAVDQSRPAATSDAATPQGRTAEEQLSDATAQLAAAELRYKPDHPDVIRQRRQVAELREKVRLEDKVRREDAARLAGPRSDALTAVESARRNQLAALHAERDSIDRQIAERQEEEGALRATMSEYQRRVDMVPTRESELIGLTRDYDTQQENYRSLLVKKGEAQMASSLERQQSGEQFRVLDPAQLPEAPFSPNRFRLNAIGALGGLVLGLALIALLESLDSVMRTHEDVIAALDLPVLAVVPVVAAGAGTFRSQVVLVAGVTLLVGVLAASWLLFL